MGLIQRIFVFVIFVSLFAFLFDTPALAQCAPGQTPVYDATGSTIIDCAGTATPQQDINPFGNIQAPSGIAGQNIFTFLNTILNVVVLAAGIYALFNLMIAGYQFMSAGGDPENIQKAWGRIWQTLVGLIIVAGSFVLAAIIGLIVFGDATAIVDPKIR